MLLYLRLARWTNISDVGLIQLAKSISHKKFRKRQGILLKHTLPNVTDESARLLFFQIQSSRMIISTLLLQFNRKLVWVTGINNLYSAITKFSELTPNQMCGYREGAYIDRPQSWKERTIEKIWHKATKYTKLLCLFWRKEIDEWRMSIKTK